MTEIKICGLTSADEALQVAALGIDVIGMVLAPSRRRISLQMAKDIVRQVKKGQQRATLAGIFVNEPVQTVNDSAAYCGLDIVQLSGDESWEYCRKLEHPFIKVIHVTDNSSTAEIIDRIERGNLARFKQPFVCMLDCKSGGNYGGSGRSFDWEIAREASLRFPLFIAGGLHAGNVRQLIRQACPAGVDVSSGVETNGKKDMEKVRDFVRAVKFTGGQADQRTALIKSLLRKGEKNVS